MLVAYQWGKQVADDAARAGFDLDRDRHSGREIDGLILDLHLRTVERYTRSVNELLTLRLAAACFRALRLLDRLVRRRVPGDGVVGGGKDRPMQQAVAREIEGVAVDRRF